jgi:hypothetical protein
MPDISKPIGKHGSVLPPRNQSLEKPGYSHVTSIPPRGPASGSAGDVSVITPQQVGRSLPRPRHTSAEDEEWDAAGVILARSKASSGSLVP